jgi:hypothetical protein
MEEIKRGTYSQSALMWFPFFPLVYIGGTGQVVLTISSGTRGCTARMREEFC